MSEKRSFRKIAVGLVSLWLLIEEIPAVKRLLSAVTGFDFIYEKYRDPGWLGEALNMALNPPPGTALLVAVVGMALIYWSTKPREIRMSLPVTPDGSEGRIANDASEKIERPLRPTLAGDGHSTRTRGNACKRSSNIKAGYFCKLWGYSNSRR